MSPEINEDISPVLKQFGATGDTLSDVTAANYAAAAWKYLPDTIIDIYMLNYYNSNMTESELEKVVQKAYDLFPTLLAEIKKRRTMNNNQVKIENTIIDKVLTLHERLYNPDAGMFYCAECTAEAKQFKEYPCTTIKHCGLENAEPPLIIGGT